MYIRTEQNETVNSQDYDPPYVVPYSTETGWSLLMNRKVDDASMIIGTFENVKKANDALDSLNKAIQEEKGWDAIFYMKNDSADASYGYD